MYGALCTEVTLRVISALVQFGTWADYSLKVGFEVLTAVTMNDIIFWDVIPCGLVEVH
jgi:hypothetical protein